MDLTASLLSAETDAQAHGVLRAVERDFLRDNSGFGRQAPGSRYSAVSIESAQGLAAIGNQPKTRGIYLGYLKSRMEDRPGWESSEDTKLQVGFHELALSTLSAWPKPDKDRIFNQTRLHLQEDPKVHLAHQPVLLLSTMDRELAPRLLAHTETPSHPGSPSYAQLLDGSRLHRHVAERHAIVALANRKPKDQGTPQARERFLHDHVPFVLNWGYQLPVEAYAHLPAAEREHFSAKATRTAGGVILYDHQKEIPRADTTRGLALLAEAKVRVRPDPMANLVARRYATAISHREQG